MTHTAGPDICDLVADSDLAALRGRADDTALLWDLADGPSSKVATTR
jgi:hypothetical protein